MVAYKMRTLHALFVIILIVEGFLGKIFSFTSAGFGTAARITRGYGGYFLRGTALMRDYFSLAKRSRIMSWWSVAHLVGILVGFAVGGVVSDLYFGSWRLAFIFTGIPGLLLAWLVWRVREPRRNQVDEESIEIDPQSLGNVTEVGE